MEEPVVLEREEARLVGMLHRPDRMAAPVPAVLFLHGFTGAKTEKHRLFVYAARRLADRGMASLRIDFMGSGDSSGDFVDCTIGTQCADAAAALAWLKARDDIDANRLGVVGLSLGGMIAALTLGNDPALAAGVLLCPVADPRLLADSRVGPAQREALAGQDWADMGGYAVSRAFLDSMIRSDPVHALACTRAAVRIIHGDTDTSVPVEQSKAYNETLVQAGCKEDRIVIPGCDHNFSAIPWREQVIDLVEEWMARWLDPE